MTPGDPVGWWGALPAVLTTVAVLLVPGGVAVRLLGVRGLLAVGVAPLVSVSTIAGGAVVVQPLGLPWRPATFVGVVVVSWLAAAGVGRLVPRAGKDVGPLRARGWLAGTTVAAALVIWVYLRLTDGPTNFPQQPDTVFHLGLIRWIVEGGDASSLHAGGYSATDNAFYPAAFHDVAATVGLLTGASAFVTAAALALVTAALVWPLGAVLLARLVIGEGRAVPLATGVIAAAASTFPFWLMGYGVLWPLLLGYALVPGALALGVCVLRPRTGRIGRASAVVLLVVALPGVALAHPGALIALVPFGLLAVLERLAEGAVSRWRAGRRRRAVLVVAGLLAVVAVTAVGWLAVASLAAGLRGSNPLGAETTPAGALLDAVGFASRGGPRAWVLVACVVVGAVVLTRRRGGRWLLGAWLFTVLLYVAIAGYDTPTTRWLTWPWYNNTPRFAALVVLPGVLVAAAGLSAPARWLTDRRRRGERFVRDPWWAAATLPVLVLVGTGGAYASAHEAFLVRYFEPSVDRSWASRAELAALARLSTSIGPDDVTAANPWNGGSYLYPLTGRRLLLPTEKARALGDRTLLAERLDQAGRDPQVCAAVQRERVRFVITGGRPWSKLTNDGWKEYPGIDAVPQAVRAGSSVFRQVRRAGPYTLWQVTGCTP